jgi:hypothetical protein
LAFGGGLDAVESGIGERRAQAARERLDCRRRGLVRELDQQPVGDPAAEGDEAGRTQALAGEKEPRTEGEGVAQPVGLGEHRAAQGEELAADGDRVAQAQAESHQQLGRRDRAVSGQELGERARRLKLQPAVERELAVDRLELDELAAAGTSGALRRRGDSDHLGQAGRAHALRGCCFGEQLVDCRRHRFQAADAQIGGEQLARLARQRGAQARREAGDRHHRADTDGEAEHEEGDPAARAARLAHHLAQQGRGGHRAGDSPGARLGRPSTRSTRPSRR